MKVEVRCPGCQEGYLLDIEVLAEGTPCPGCGESLDSEAEATATAIDVPPPEVVVAPAAARVPARASVQATAAAVAAAVAKPPAAATAARAPAPAAAAEVVCPRCKLHFKPRADTQARVRESTDRQTILIVEDLVYFREIAAEALSGEYEVQGVATKAAAKAALRRGNVDLMVLDLTLDGGEAGLDLLRELSGKPCPILIYTAQDESEMYGESWDELKGLGADDIVIKGMNVGDELSRKVGTLLGRHWDDED